MPVWNQVQYTALRNLYAQTSCYAQQNWATDRLQMGPGVAGDLLSKEFPKG